MSFSEYPEPNKTRIDAVPDETIAAALIRCKGLQYLAAEQIDLCKSAVCQRVKASPYLQQVIRECLETRLDKAEFNLALMTEDKELGAICFLLKTKGKERGYVENKDEVKIDPKTIEFLEKFNAYLDSSRKSCDNTNIKE